MSASSAVADCCVHSSVSRTSLRLASTPVLALCHFVGSGEVWSAGSNGDAQLGLGPDLGIKNPEFRLVKRLKGVQLGYAIPLNVPCRAVVTAQYRAECARELSLQPCIFDLRHSDHMCGAATSFSGLASLSVWNGSRVSCMV